MVIERLRFIKLLYPDGEYTEEQLEQILKISLEMRRRVKEELKKLGGMEFYDVNFSYIDLETFEEHYVSVPEQGSGKLIPEGICNPGLHQHNDEGLHHQLSGLAGNWYD